MSVELRKAFADADAGKLRPNYFNLLPPPTIDELKGRVKDLRTELDAALEELEERLNERINR